MKVNIPFPWINRKGTCDQRRRPTNPHRFGEVDAPRSTGEIDLLNRQVEVEMEMDGGEGSLSFFCGNGWGKWSEKPGIKPC